MDAFTSPLALALGLGWASGLRLYATVAVVGLLGRFGYVTLPGGLTVLTDPWVIGTAALLLVVEFAADKIPLVDSVWDATQTFVRIPAGALLAYAGMADVDPLWQIIAGLLGGSLAAATHAAKTGSRALINTSPEPFSNWAASIGEDTLVLAGLALCLAYPTAFLIALCVFCAGLLWLLPKVGRGLGLVLERCARWFGGRDVAHQLEDEQHQQRRHDHTQ